MQQDITPKEYFYLHEGGSLKNFEDLFAALQDMPEHVFLHHVNEEKNDFARWSRDVFGEVALARKLDTTKSIGQIRKIVFTRLFL